MKRGRCTMIGAGAIGALAASPANGQAVQAGGPMPEREPGRAALPQSAPVQLQLSYGSDAQLLVSGGVRPGSNYVGGRWVLSAAGLGGVGGGARAGAPHRVPP